MNMWGPYIYGGYKSTFFKYSCDAMSQEIPIHADSPRFIPRRILVVEDNPLFEQVIGQVIESLGIDGKTYFCQTGSQALSLCDDNKVGLDLALVDLGLPDISGIEVIQGLRRRYPNLPIMVISVISTERSVLAAVRAGARGYILKGDSKAAITQAIQELMLGNYPITPALARYLFKMAGGATGTSANTEHKLSPRELETLQHLSKGHKYEEVARIMGIALSTVQYNIRNLYRKLDANSQMQAVTKARDQGLI